MAASDRTTAIVAGGGPAGMVLGLLLARAGVEATVLEKHADFLRDFRGDTVHPTTLDLLDQLGLMEEFRRIPQGRLQRMAIREDLVIGDLRELDLRHPYVAIAPQWDFLNLLAHTAAAYPTFHLLMQSQAIGLLRDDSGRVTGVRYRDAGGREQELHGDVVFGTDGRHSTIRPAAGLRTESFGAPFDVLWFRLPKSDAEKDELYFRVAPYRWVVGFDRRTYIQMAYIIRKGAHEQVQAEGIDRFRTHLAQVVPEVADRVGALRSFDDIKFLEVQVNRAPRWHQPGLLLIGDAAHAMSPIGGVGVNYAIQDAVAAANLLADHLLRAQRSGTPVPEEALHRVQRRRMRPTVVIQTLQRIMQARLIEPALRGHVSAVPRVARVLQRVGPLRRLFVRTLIVGVRPERIETPLVYPTPRAQPRRRAG